MSDPPPDWLTRVRALQSIAQAGLTYARDPHDVERYEAVRRIAAEIGAAHSDGDVDDIAGFFAGERGHPTPKLDVRAAVIADGRILLVRERDDGGWSMPGGWADIGESAAEAAVRETREEAGVEVRAVKLIALLDRERRGHPPHREFSYKAFFGCELCGEAKGADLHDAEVSDVGWFRADALPELSVARLTPAEVALAFEHHRRPELPTEFD